MLYRTPDGEFTSQHELLEDDSVIKVHLLKPAQDTQCFTESHLASQFQADENTAAWLSNTSQDVVTDNSTTCKHDDDLSIHWMSSVTEPTWNCQGVCSNHTSVASHTASDDWTEEPNWNQSLSGIARNFTSCTNATEKKEGVPRHLQSASNVYQHVEADVDVLEAAHIALTVNSTARGQLSTLVSSSWQSVTDVSEVNRDRVIGNVTESCHSRGRGLLKYRHMQTVKMASMTRSGWGGGRAEVGCESTGTLYRTITPPGMKLVETLTDDNAVTRIKVSQTSTDTVCSLPSRNQHSLTDKHLAVGESSIGGITERLLNEGCLAQTTSKSECDSRELAMRADQKSLLKQSIINTSTGRSCFTIPPGFTVPASVPATYAVPLTSYHPHMMPYMPTPPPPVCGIVAPSATVPVVGMMPYSRMPVCHAYGYQVMPGSWPVLPPSAFGSLPADENSGNVDKVD